MPIRLSLRYYLLALRGSFSGGPVQWHVQFTQRVIVAYVFVAFAWVLVVTFGREVASATYPIAVAAALIVHAASAAIPAWWKNARWLRHSLACATRAAVLALLALAILNVPMLGTLGCVAGGFDMVCGFLPFYLFPPELFFHMLLFGLLALVGAIPVALLTRLVRNAVDAVEQRRSTV